MEDEGFWSDRLEKIIRLRVLDMTHERRKMPKHWCGLERKMKWWASDDLDLEKDYSWYPKLQ